jgi:hypothetical protein
MPLVPFASLPDDARVWVFAAMAPLDEVDEPRLLAAVDGYLLTWKAHGAALTCAREFREEYFLAVGVDERTSGASGCSVDGLFRVLQKMEDGIGTSMVGGGNVYFRDPNGMVVWATRSQFELMSKLREVSGETTVFDFTVTTAGEFRARFELRAQDSWHKALLIA